MRGTRQSPAAASGEAPGPGRREDSESEPGRLHSAELMAARFARRPQTAQSQPQAAAPAGARTVREGVLPQTAQCGGRRPGTTASHESDRSARLDSVAFHLPCRLARPRLHPSRELLPAPAQAEAEAHCPGDRQRVSPLSRHSTGAGRPHSPLRHGRSTREWGRM